MIENHDSYSIFFSVCIVTYRRPALLQKCLECVSPSRQTLDSILYEVIVSDDCPEQSARPVIEKTRFSRWIQGPSHGIAANRNHVARAAMGEWIVFVDDDELPEPDWLENYYHAAKTGRWDVLEGSVAPMSYPDNILWYAPRVSSGGKFCTANLAIRRQVFFRLGAYDERLRVSHEDAEFGIRIQKSVFRSAFIRDALVKHPARRITLSQAWQIMIQQQCQCFVLQHRDISLRRCGFYSLLYVFAWSLKFWIRTTRLEMLCRYPGHWRRPVQSILLRMIASPLAMRKIWFAPDLQVVANQKWR